MTWTTDRIDTLKSLWQAGLPTPQIAARIGDVSKNAVIGKANRLGLPARPSGNHDRRTPAARQRPSLPGPKPRTRAISTHIPPLGEAPDPPPQTRDLKPHHCRWPEGDPKRPGFHFCGCPHDGASPYCAHHHARAVQPHSRRPAPDTLSTTDRKPKP